MNKGVESAIILGLFSVAVGYLGWRAWEALRPKADAGCGKGCGCTEPPKKSQKVLGLWIGLLASLTTYAQPKAVLVILDGIPADVVERVHTPFLDEISAAGGYTRSYTGGKKGHYTQSPTISAVSYNHLITGVWTYKHNVWGNDISAPNYAYWSIFRLVKNQKKQLRTAIFSTWLDNRTKLVGEGLPDTDQVKFDYAFDGFELDTVRFPHDATKRYIYDIDELVSQEAARYLAAEGPDMSWVYLEYTDDVGHAYGDGPEQEDAVRKADQQLGRIWKAIKQRQAATGEQWMLVVTTDHGRTASDGKGHGGQSDRERITWIATNRADRNAHWNGTPAAVDVMPSLARHLGLSIPEAVAAELDGVPFVGEVSIRNLTASEQSRGKLLLRWEVLAPEGEAEIWLSTTNHHETGGEDRYHRVGRTPVKDGKAEVDLRAFPSDFYKILLKAPHNQQATWVHR